MKASIGLPFPNLPYLTTDDGSVMLSQSNACLRYIGRRFDMLGKTENERQRVDQLLEEGMDLRNSVVGVAYGRSGEEARAVWFAETIPNKMKLLDAYLGDRAFMASETEPTVADFIYYELLDQIRLMSDGGLLEPGNRSAPFSAAAPPLPRL